MSKSIKRLEKIFSKLNKTLNEAVLEDFDSKDKLSFNTTRTLVVGLFIILKDNGMLDAKSDYKLSLCIESSTKYDGKNMKSIVGEIHKFRHYYKDTEVIKKFWAEFFQSAKISTTDLDLV
jgi:hypothetical protein